MWSEFPSGERVGSPARSRPPAAWLAVLLAAVVVGSFLRLDQFGAQVLIDDEWHAVHQVLQRTPRQMFLDFGTADYSIPLGILDWYLSRGWGLSESAMRLPMLLCGLVTLVLLPLYVAPRLGRATAGLFALLLAISPLLVIYSRLARPYAITLLLGWIAHAAFQRYHASTRGRTAAGLGYGTAATLAVWLHPIAAPFVLAPLLWALAQLRRVAPAARRAHTLRLARLALPTGVAMAVLILPPLFARPQSLASKSGIDMPGLEALAGVWYAWLGTGSTAVVLVCVALATVRRPGRLAHAARGAHRGARCRLDRGRGHPCASGMEPVFLDAGALPAPVPSVTASWRSGRLRPGRGIASPGHRRRCVEGLPRQ